MVPWPHAQSKQTAVQMQHIKDNRGLMWLLTEIGRDIECVFGADGFTGDILCNLNGLTTSHKEVKMTKWRATLILINNVNFKSLEFILSPVAHAIYTCTVLSSVRPSAVFESHNKPLASDIHVPWK